MQVEPCTCDGPEVLHCEKLCCNAPEYLALAGEAEYASWFPIRRKRRARQAVYMDPQRARELGLPGAARGVAAAEAPSNTFRLRQTLEAATRCLQRNDWGTAFDRVQDALALLPDGVLPSEAPSTKGGA